MSLLKKSLIAPSLAILLATNLYSANYTVDTTNATKAIEKISELSNIPFIVDTNILNGKNTNKIQNVQNLDEALKLMFEGTGLEAVVKNNTIVIKKIEGKGTVLEPISVKDVYLGSTTENSNSYTTGSMNTATKLDLSIRETPQSVKVLTREYLDDANITSYQELLNNVTGVSINRGDERVSPTARGFSVDYFLYDGVPSEYWYYDSSDSDLVIYDRVEVVKGANGLMTGAGNPALGMNFIRKHANSKVFKGNIDVSAGSWDNYSASLDVQTPLNTDGTIRARLVAKHQDSKSFIDKYEQERDTLYGVVDMDLTDTTQLSLATSYQKNDRNGVRWGGLPAFYTDGTKTDFNRKTAVTDDWTYWNSETKTIYASLTQYLYEDISLNMNYTHKKLSQDNALYYFDGKVDKSTGTGIGTVYDNVYDEELKDDNFDIYASIPFTLGGLDHEIVTGFTYNKRNFKGKIKTNNSPSSLSNPLINFYDINIPNSFLKANQNSVPTKTTQTGTYLAGKFSLMEDLKLITGIRISNWEYKNKATGSGNREFNNELTPYAGLIFDIDENHSVYTSYTDIFKPQNRKDKDDQYLDPIVGKNYETGIKGEYFDKRLNTALSIFRVEQDGVGEVDNSGRNIVTGGIAYKASKGVVSKGVEFEVDGEITDNWNISFGIANFEAKDAQDEKFNTTSSRTTTNLFTKYKITNDLSIGGGLNYKSKVHSGSGTSQITQDAYMIANAMASYKVSKDLKVQLNINNLFDKKYYEGIEDNYMSYGEPRSFTLGMKYSF
ncbi:TonB-dependent siderophore receptor [Aliarcobacter butzleri]|uniref:TonB-dependent siderophore receptor n=1 Tax=Aliarcobacter butzleri TaxID=28197 RepID=UPI0012611D85|nr:TonB-dependent siderophore receptor [Aliarcobacter butzleri]MDN5077289.1 TonB-dependent siderophore receptor [Aliarcobacter butzleri]MDN5118405.1 TonB-dependent siderophore receptor [Aliarcobacter butzleri]